MGWAKATPLMLIDALDSDKLVTGPSLLAARCWRMT